MSDKLKPCPFCGYENVIEKDIIENPLIDVYCPSCDVCVCWRSQEHEISIKRWNTRAEDKK
jgi:Lar family restriction alleviation protein